jgi:radical SAM superfamily enzyme YgiQ (UPF0313 family)
MRIAFLQDNGLNESLNLTEVAGVLRGKGHVYEVFLERNERDLESAIRRFGPDVFVVPCDVLGHTKALRLARRGKAAVDRPVIMPGTHPSLFPEIARDPAVHCIIRGEAEYALLETLERLGDRQALAQTPNVGVVVDGELRLVPLRPLIQNLDELPLPDRAMYYKYRFLAQATTKRFTSGRGCPHNCTFCYNPVFREQYRGLGGFLRKKSPTRVADEALEVGARYPLRNVHFSDDLFPLFPEWIAAFSDEWRRRVRLPFSMNASVELLGDRTIEHLAAAGCHSIALGLESGVESLRRRILNKHFTNEDLFRVCRKIRECGIDLLTFNVIGSPGETIDDAFETIRVNRQIGAKYCRAFLIFPIPKTEFHRHCVENGWADRGRLQSIDYLDYIEQTGFSHRSALDLPEKEQFETLLSFFPLLVMFPQLEKTVRRLLAGPRRRIYRLLELLFPYHEKRFFRISWLSGLRFFWNTGLPARKTKNINNYIP